MRTFHCSYLAYGRVASVSAVVVVAIDFAVPQHRRDVFEKIGSREPVKMGHHEPICRRRPMDSIPPRPCPPLPQFSALTILFRELTILFREQNIHPLPLNNF